MTFDGADALALRGAATAIARARIISMS